MTSEYNDECEDMPTQIPSLKNAFNTAKTSPLNSINSGFSITSGLP